MDTELTTPLVIGFFGSFLMLGILTLTAFVKLSVVLLILRNAIGLQQVPSNLVLMTITLFLAVFISLPVFSQVITTLADADLSDQSLDVLFETITQAFAPFQAFIVRHTDPEQIAFFIEISNVVWEGSGFTATEDQFFVQVPAFLISELTRAFEIGFLMYLPFIAVDLAITVVLMAMGMQQVQPTIISTPFKLLLFVALDGWTKLVDGLLLSYGAV